MYGNTILTSNSKKDLRMIMPEIKCPKCNTQIYDNTSFFCYRCGAKLSANIPEKAPDLREVKDHLKYYKTTTPERKSGVIRDDPLSAQKPTAVQPVKPESGDDFFPEPKQALFQPVKPESGDDFLSARKPAPIQTVKPVEICAQCGGPITGKNRVFCENCGVNIREELSGGVSSIVNHPVLNSRVCTPVIHQNTENKTIKKQESVLFHDTSELIQLKGRKLIVIIAGIIILIIMLMLVFMLMLTFWASLS